MQHEVRFLKIAKQILQIDEFKNRCDFIFIYLKSCALSSCE